MENLLLWILFVVAAVAVYQHATNLNAKVKIQQNSIDVLRTELGELREKVSDLTDDFERHALTPTQLEAKYFERLAALTSDTLAPLQSGEMLGLVLKTYTDQGLPLFYPVEYIHRELVYRTPGQKDAVALGQARLDASDDFRDVRILFSRPHASTLSNPY
jgi:hypothetical protein